MGRSPYSLAHLLLPPFAMEELPLNAHHTPAGVIILGARGMLGRAMAEVWADTEPLLLDRDELDLTDERAINAMFETHHPELLINCAAYTAVDDCETNEEAALAVNGLAVGYLARAAAETNARLIHFSTDYVFDGCRPDGYPEDAIPNPHSAYGRTKAFGEREWINAGCDGYIIRTSWLYGPGGKNFVDTIIGHGRQRPEVNVVNDQHGAPTYTLDLARFTRQLVDDDFAVGIYHGVNSGTATWFDLATLAFELAGVASMVAPCTTAEFPRPAPRPEWSVLLNSYGPGMRPWPDALRSYLLT